MDTQSPKLGLVLSGGGAKGIAHLGVLKCLEEQGIKADIIAGTSAGAIVASLYCAGLDVEEILQFFIESKPFSWKFARAHAGLIDSAKLYPLLNRYITDDNFDCLNTELRIVATNLLSGKEEIFTQGSVINAVLASASYPLIFSPMVIDGQIYADGGIVNHFPVSTIEYDCDRLIGVYVSPIKQVDATEMSSIKNVILRALSLQGSGAELEKLAQCDVQIYPERLLDYNTFDTDEISLREIFAIGYQAAMAQVPNLQELNSQHTIAV